MNKHIVSVGFNRPALHNVSLRSIEKMRRLDEFSFTVSIDGKGDTPTIPAGAALVEHPSNLGLSRHILGTLKRCFEDLDADFVVLIEDDVVPSADFLEYLLYCEANFRDDETFTIGGWSRNMRMHYEQKDERVVKMNWFHPWGLAYSRRDYQLITPHICDQYFTSPRDYIVNNFDRWAQQEDPGYWETQLQHKNAINPLQAGLINTIRACNGKRQLIPLSSRCQNIGYYGYNQRRKDPISCDDDSDNFESSIHYTGAYRDDYTWQELELLHGSHDVQFSK